MNSNEVVVTAFICVNVAAFFVVIADKRKSLRDRSSDRTPEGVLFFMASIFGAVGVYAAMLLFRHKTRKWYFMIGVPLLILQNLAGLYLLLSGFSLA